ncbi:putative uncharacterized membrane protein [Helianthus annuus]|uniref:Uncharacterized membrane protein n=1 Tax=Helianthus annuus TaxID=4232 RepID=A0A251TY95_HELAN|nr:uncharacterized membrane protein At3g27390 [Helianthus annuus]KAF5791764.1 putative uncharacterized membrane protein [Helianthus annuus]KAJ0526779.1 putative uncharacterized membrane protein [Helianthus annuus]KAJ0535311.1 putative uncharacterized membrane protein [Helianthus annuus]KAJ0543174.1 putative uncharacterized membrane protein [Helianthus annuus]KAJ0708225.1 putative uncharacterized membrane protein [Helianthus annuus]
MLNVLPDWLKIIYVVFAFCSALFFGAFKSLLVGPIAALILIVGNVVVILALFPTHVAWTVYTLLKTHRFDAPLKVAFLFGVPALFGLWLSLSIGGSVLVGVGYGFFAPLISSFEAFRQEDESHKFFHSIVDGTWGTIKGSCTVVRDFADICYHSYPLYLKELRETPASNELRTLRLIHVPACIIVGLLGLIVDVPLYTAIAIIKSPYMLFKGWQRLIHDLISREGPFLETACIPIAGLTILVWPIVVIGSVIMAIVSSIFIGLYGSAIVYQERSFKRGVAYVIAMVAEFDEYTNDWLYLREGSIFPKPKYRKKRVSHSPDVSVGGSRSSEGKHSGHHHPMQAPGVMLMPTLSSSRSVREVIREVKMVQVWENLMQSSESVGKELLDANVITPGELYDWLNAKKGNESAIIGIGLPCYSFFQNLLRSIKVGSEGLVLLDGLEITHLNRPQDRLLDWFFHPIMVIKEQIRVIQLSEGEIRYLEKVILFGSDSQRMKSWDNGSYEPEDTLRLAQIQGISRRLIGLTRGASKLPTYRRKYRQVIKKLILYCMDKDGTTRSMSMRSVASV